MNRIKEAGKLLYPAVAYGDAAGLPVETMSADEISRRYGRISSLMSTEGNPFFSGEFKPGQWSDDTQLTLAVGDSFIQADSFDADALAAEHIKTYEQTPLVEFKGKLQPRGWGGSTTDSVRRMIAGTPPLEAGSADGLGNGVLMKMAPLVLWQAAVGTDHRTRLEQYDQLTQMTHNNVIAKVCTRIHGDTLYQLLMNNPRDRDLIVIMKAAALVHEKHLGEETRVVSKALQYLEEGEFDQDKILAATDGKGFYAPQTLAMTYGVYLGSAKNYETTIYNAVNLGGDTDSTASICGAMLAFSQGEELTLPADISHVRDIERLRFASESFVEAALEEV